MCKKIEMLGSCWAVEKTTVHAGEFNRNIEEEHQTQHAWMVNKRR